MRKIDLLGWEFKYPKLVGLVICIILAYVVFSAPGVADLVNSLGEWGYVGIFIAGIFYAFGFTAPFSAGFLVTLHPEHVVLCALIGGLGALAGDMLIFQFIRIGFRDEFDELRKSDVIRFFDRFVNWSVGRSLKIYLLYTLACFALASPLPDEIGIVLLAGLTNIKVGIMGLLGFFLNTLGILLLLSL